MPSDGQITDPDHKATWRTAYRAARLALRNRADLKIARTYGPFCVACNAEATVARAVLASLSRSRQGGILPCVLTTAAKLAMGSPRDRSPSDPAPLDFAAWAERRAWNEAVRRIHTAGHAVAYDKRGWPVAASAQAA